MATNRYLTAIMFTDLAGYSSMMEEDEARALSTLRTNRKIHKKHLKKYNGRFLKEMGDGMLMRFPTASDAVYCAGALLAEANENNITLRIGIHLGEVTEDNGDVFGDGVNIASRIESIAKPGSIYISDSIARNVGNKTGIITHEVGEEKLKNISEPVRVYRAEVDPDEYGAPGHERSRAGNTPITNIKYAAGAFALLAVLALLWWTFAANDSLHQITDRSIAVLPFETIGENKSSSFTKGIEGGLLTRLSNVSGLKVTSRTSTLRYRNQIKPIPEISRELNVSWIVRGEVQETENLVQVNARLISGPEDRQVWAKNYQRKLTANNLFEIQGDLAKQITRELQTRLSPEEQIRVERKPTQNLNAYRLYAQGVALLEQRTAPAVVQSINYLIKATEEDSTYAPAWAVLAEALIIGDYYGYTSMDNFNITPRRAIDTALNLNPELAEGHASLGIYQYTRKNGPASIQALEKAIQLQPSYEAAQNWLGFIYLLLGYPEEALDHSEKAIELNPLAPASRLYPSLTYLANGDEQQAKNEARRAREIQPGWGEVYAIEGVILYHGGQYERAKKSLAKADSLIGSTKSIWIPNIQAMQALAHVATGDLNSARSLMANIDSQDNLFWIGLVQAALDKREEAFESFQLIENFTMWPSISLRYFFPKVLEPLRKDPRYQPLLDRMDQNWNNNSVL